MARQSLGRGLSALIGDEMVAAPKESSHDVEIALIEPNPEQPRSTFKEEDLEELTQSIRANGVVQPIVLRRKKTGYEIVAGERRWRAALRADLKRIPAIVREVTDEKMLELALVENIQRQQLNPIEEARAYRKLVDTLGLTQDEVSERVGKSRTVITTAIRLLRLPETVQRELETGRLSAGHGRALLLTDDLKIQTQVATTVIERGLSVRETERAIKRLIAGPTQHVDKKRVIVSVDANVRAAETKLMRTLNTNVKIRPGAKGSGGKVEIEYYSIDDLDRIFSLLIKK